MTADPSAVRSPTRARVRVWRGGEVVEDGPMTDALVERIADATCLVWVDLVDPSVEDLDRLAREVGLDAAAVEDAVAPLERPKVVRHAGHLFFHDVRDAAAGRRRDPRRRPRPARPPPGVRVRPPCGTHHGPAGRGSRHGGGRRAVGRQPRPPRAGTERARLWPARPRRRRPVRDDPAARRRSSSRLEDVLFGRAANPGAFLQHVYDVRKDLVLLRRVVLPMREVVNALLRHRVQEEGELARWYDDLYDHVLRAAEWTESLRDMVTTVFETNLSLQDTRLNIVMKKLAGWAADHRRPHRRHRLVRPERSVPRVLHLGRAVDERAPHRRAVAQAVCPLPPSRLALAALRGPGEPGSGTDGTPSVRRTRPVAPAGGQRPTLPCMIPPSTNRVVAVAYPPLSEARNTTAERDLLGLGHPAEGDGRVERP